MTHKIDCKNYKAQRSITVTVKRIETGVEVLISKCAICEHQYTVDDIIPKMTIN
jgi:hypothetical protein